MVVSPHALLESQGRLRLHANYYITKQIIPALERVISLVSLSPLLTAAVQQTHQVCTVAGQVQPSASAFCLFLLLAP